MKASFILTMLISVFASAAKLRVNYENVLCKIENGNVEVERYYGNPNDRTSFVETKKITTKGFDKLVDSVVSVSSQKQPTDSVTYLFTIKQNDKTYYVDVKNSPESFRLMKVATSICR